MSNNIIFGVIEFDEEVLCDEDVLGENFSISVDGNFYSFEFPVSSSEYDYTSFDYLQHPLHCPDFKEVSWGNVYSRPDIKAGVKAVSCFIRIGENVSEQNLFKVLGHWKLKFESIMKMKSAKLVPEQETICFERDDKGNGGFNTGVHLFHTDNHKFEAFYNYGKINITIPLVKDTCYISK